MDPAELGAAIALPDPALIVLDASADAFALLDQIVTARLRRGLTAVACRRFRLSAVTRAIHREPGLPRACDPVRLKVAGNSSSAVSGDHRESYRNREEEVIAVEIGAGREMFLPVEHVMRAGGGCDV